MAGVSTKEIKNRIRSMESTRQITKAMEMVAASKLRQAQAQVQNSRPYFQILSDVMADIVAANRDFSSAYFDSRSGKKAVYIVIAGDRGLAGGYNSNILKQAASAIGNTDAAVVPIGKKAMEFFSARKRTLVTRQYGVTAEMKIGDCFTLSKQLCKMFLTGEVDEMFICYTRCISVLQQQPQIIQLLPLTRQTDAAADRKDILYEPNSTDVFDTIVPEYVGGVLYGALCDSRASEQAARRTAMDAATQNAEDMIDQLSLKFNQARQAAITQEITEIVAGS